MRVTLKKVEEKNEKKLLRPKRERKSMDITSGENQHCDVEPQRKKYKIDLDADTIKKRRLQPSPLSYQELLKIAEKMQHEPIMI